MNKQSAQLIPAVGIQPPPDTGINGVLDKYVQRVNSTYLSPANTLYYQSGQFGVPYWMQGLALQTCVNMYISAPEPWQKNILTHQVSTIYNAGQYGNGQAPTNGVYTGVEDGCS